MMADYSSTALKMLCAAAQATDGCIMLASDALKALSVKTNRKIFHYAVSREEKSDVYGSFGELLSDGLIEELGGGDYIITKEGVILPINWKCS